MKKIFFLLLISVQSFAQNNSAPDILTKTLLTIEGKTFSMTEISKNSASVFVFLLADCPACQNYALTLNQMNEKYKANGIGFYGVFPGIYTKANEIKDYQSTYKIKFELLTDKEKNLVKALHAKTAPQVFLLDNSGVVLYSGRIDDWMYAVGKKRTVITHHELEDALNAYVHKQKILVTSTQPVGCIIE